MMLSLAKAAFSRPRCIAGLRIDEMRGLAALLVVTFHAVASEPLMQAGIIGHAVETLSFVRMPLFIAITGYLYGAQREQRPMTMTGWYKRMKRIVPPFLLLTLVCWIISIPTDHRFNVITGLVFGAWHLWYLQALCLVLLLTALVDTLIRPSNQQLWWITVGAFLFSASGVAAGIGWFSIGKAIYLLPYFLLGASIGAAPELINDRENRWAIYTCGIIAFIIQQSGMAGVGWCWSKTSLIAGAIGGTSFIILGRHMFEDKILRRIGSYSFPIFLWHLPVSSALSAAIFNPLAMDIHVALLIKIALDIGVPIAMSVWCAQYFNYGLSFVGQRSVGKVLRASN